jgi:hypothetical protein
VLLVLFKNGLQCCNARKIDIKRSATLYKRVEAYQKREKGACPRGVVLDHKSVGFKPDALECLSLSLEQHKIHMPLKNEHFTTCWLCSVNDLTEPTGAAESVGTAGRDRIHGAGEGRTYFLVPSVFGRNLQCKPVRGVNFREECHWSHACSLQANMRGIQWHPRV